MEKQTGSTPKEAKIFGDFHLQNLQVEITWLQQCIQNRISATKDQLESEVIPQPPELVQEGSVFGYTIGNNGASAQERLVIILALAPHIAPNILDVLIEDDDIRKLAKLGQSENGTHLLPTVGTALFLLAGTDVAERAELQHLFDTDYPLIKESVIDIGETGKGEPLSCATLRISQNFIDLFVHNRQRKPRFSADFPAHQLTTKLEWDDLVLMPGTRDRLEEVKAYLQHYNTLVHEWNMAKHAKPGCRILFYGDSGTGKTLAASLLGKYLKQDVYRVDISTIASKYIGETSKRLNSLFNTAESKGWILFFDEGDALLGERKQTGGDSNASQYANQDVAFLLQRIENYDGVVIVATNLKNNIDQAFTRRFQSMVRFYAPDDELQYRFWMDNLPEKCPLAADVDLKVLIKRHALSPAAIINVIFRVSVLALEKGANEISMADLQMCVRDEEFKYKGRQAMGH